MPCRLCQFYFDVATTLTGSFFCFLVRVGYSSVCLFFDGLCVSLLLPPLSKYLCLRLSFRLWLLRGSVAFSDEEDGAEEVEMDEGQMEAEMDDNPWEAADAESDGKLASLATAAVFLVVLRCVVLLGWWWWWL